MQNEDEENVKCAKNFQGADHRGTAAPGWRVMWRTRSAPIARSDVP